MAPVRRFRAEGKYIPSIRSFQTLLAARGFRESALDTGTDSTGLSVEFRCSLSLKEVRQLMRQCMDGEWMAASVRVVPDVPRADDAAFRNPTLGPWSA